MSSVVGSGRRLRQVASSRDRGSRRRRRHALVVPARALCDGLRLVYVIENRTTKVIIIVKLEGRDRLSLSLENLYLPVFSVICVNVE